MRVFFENKYKIQTPHSPDENYYSIFVCVFVLVVVFCLKNFQKFSILTEIVDIFETV